MGGNERAYIFASTARHHLNTAAENKSTVYSNLDVFEFYRSMERHKVLLAFKGEINVDMLHSILQIVEDKMRRLDESPKLRKKVFHILVECLQNLYHHNEPIDEPEVYLPTSLVLIARVEDGYAIVTGNFVSNDNVESLEERLSQVNAMDDSALKMHYKSLLQNGHRSEKGGSGLGIVDIAKKSREKLEYFFVPYDRENSFFSLMVKVQ